MKKTVKLIMELIFIFILPLLFILLSIDVKKEDVYNTDNLLESETKTFEYNNQLLIDIEDPSYSNYLNYNQLIKLNELQNTSTDNQVTKTNNGDGSFTLNGTATGGTSYLYFSTNTYNLDPNHKYIVNSSNNLTGLFSLRGQVKLTADSPNSYINLNTVVTGYEILNQLFIIINEGNSVSGNIFVNIIDLTKMFGSGFEPTTIEDLSNYIDLSVFHNYTENEIMIFESNNIISENYKINYTPFGSLKKLALDQFHLNDNFIVKVLFDYTVIWFVMFLLWHLFYGLFDGLIHMLSFDRKRD